MLCINAGNPVDPSYDLQVTDLVARGIVEFVTVPRLTAEGERMLLERYPECADANAT